MRKLFVLSLIAFVGLVFLNESGVFDSLLIFLLAGAIPGTKITLSPTIMMLIFIAIAWLTVMRITTLSTLNSMSVRRFLARKHTMPKRRYSRI